MFKPICKKIIYYFENVLQTVGESVDAIILRGGFCFADYLMESMQDVCKRAGKKIISSVDREMTSFENEDTILYGAIKKSMSVSNAYDSTPRVALDDDRLSTDSIGSNLSEIVLVIGNLHVANYGCKRV